MKNVPIILLASVVLLVNPAAMAHGDSAIDLKASLAKWEKGITEWKTMWINLDFVVHVTKVEQSDRRAPE